MIGMVIHTMFIPMVMTVIAISFIWPPAGIVAGILVFMISAAYAIPVAIDGYRTHKDEQFALAEIEEERRIAQSNMTQRNKEALITWRQKHFKLPSDKE